MFVCFNRTKVFMMYMSVYSRAVYDSWDPPALHERPDSELLEAEEVRTSSRVLSASV